MTDIHSSFQDVDRASETDAFFAFLDAANNLESIQSYRHRMLELCPVQLGQRVLDIGCGVGHATLDLEKRVGDGGSVTGVDKSETLIAEARRRAGVLSAPVDYRTGDACRLAFPDDHFDVCRTERVLMYLESPEAAIEEMVRVLRPGGRFALFEFDYDNLVVDAEDEELTRRILRFVSRSIPSPWIGRQLRRLMLDRGAVNLEVLPHMIATPLEMFRRVVGGTVSEGVERGAFEAAQIDRWWQDLERSESQGRFFSGFFGFVVCGQLAD
ncbi:MAG: methyltransferase domain-containing protein [Rhizobiaceae bacterium]|nr:methyltransferase domain-containing protein [Rhizobiaceae bacterium]